MYFFDLDGTLLDSNGIWLDIDIEFLGRRGISPVPEDYTDYVTHHSAPDAARYTRERFSLPETPEEIMEGWMSMARSAYAHTLPLKPGVPAFLDACRRRGTRMAVLTSCMPPLCRAALEHHRLLDCFEAVYTTAELGIEKRDRLSTVWRRNGRASLPSPASSSKILPATVLRPGRLASLW